MRDTWWSPRGRGWEWNSTKRPSRNTRSRTRSLRPPSRETDQSPIASRSLLEPSSAKLVDVAGKLGQVDRVRYGITITVVPSSI